ncbi:MAG: GTPase Era [Proteobacteria bacterium]|nr:GTPase Era [Pseudomonadota bacterium]
MTERQREAPHRAGAAALLGPPNVGKSTLLNAILGTKLAIVTAKPQTTRSRILGIHHRPDAQILLLDTPGLHESGKVLNSALNGSVVSAVEDCDAGLLLVDARRGWQPANDRLWEALGAAGKPVVVAITKADLGDGCPADWPEAVRQLAPVLPVSALQGEGLEPLLDAVVEVLPESPPLYPEDELTDRSLRWLAAELVREALFMELEQELPYQIAVEVTEFDESRRDLVHIRASLLVTRNSQKRIVIGRGGEVIKRIGIAARREIEALLESKVHLELWVKVEPRWLKNPERIQSLGYV